MHTYRDAYIYRSNIGADIYGGAYTELCVEVHAYIDAHICRCTHTHIHTFIAAQTH